MAELVDCSDALEGRGGYDYGERWRRARSGGRERENQGRGRNERVGERCGASRGVVRSIQRDEGRTGRQGGRRWRGVVVPVRRAHAHPPGKEEDDRGGGGGLGQRAGPAIGTGQVGQVSPFLSLFYLFLFSISFLCFELVKMLIHFF